MIADGNHLRECGNLVVVDLFRNAYQTVRTGRNLLLHEPVHTAAAELAGTQVVFRRHIAVLRRHIGNHGNFVSLLKFSRRVVNDRADGLVDERHRELLPEDLLRTPALVIPLVCIADGKMCGPDQDFPGIQPDILKGRLKLPGTHQLIHRIKHLSSFLQTQQRLRYRNVIWICDLYVGMFPLYQMNMLALQHHDLAGVREDLTFLIGKGFVSLF